jgi:purine-binding chemotaxis protein CheW
MAIQAVIEPADLVRVPWPPPRLLGLCIHRRIVIPVFRLDEPGPADEEVEKPTILLVRSEQGCWGLRVNRSGLDVIEGPVPPSPDGTGSGIVNALVHQDRSHAVLDAETMWLDLRNEIELWYAQVRNSAGSSEADSRPRVL